MFIGHIAVGLAAKRMAPRTPLGLLVAAPMLLDLLWPFFLLAGWEKVAIDPGNTAFTPYAFIFYPFSHSLGMSVVWGLLFARIYWAITRYKLGALALGLGVISHWFLDALAHRPDMPIYPGGTRFVGLGLWNSIPGTLVVESTIFFAGLWIYVKGTSTQDRIGREVFWAFVCFVLLIYYMSPWNPPAPNERVLAYAALSGWLLPLWTGLCDRHRAIKKEA